jgi:hypothetical protein
VTATVDELSLVREGVTLDRFPCVCVADRGRNVPRSIPQRILRPFPHMRHQSSLCYRQASSVRYISL